MTNFYIFECIEIYSNLAINDRFWPLSLSKGGGWYWDFGISWKNRSKSQYFFLDGPFKRHPNFNFQHNFNSPGAASLCCVTDCVLWRGHYFAARRLSLLLWKDDVLCHRRYFVTHSLLSATGAALRHRHYFSPQGLWGFKAIRGYPSIVVPPYSLATTPYSPTAAKI